MPLVALEETACDAQVLTNLLCEANPVGQGEFNEIPNIYCCQIFETNGIPAFLTSVDADLGVVQRISCHMIFRTSFGYYAFPREWNMEDNPTVRSERYVAIVKKMMARCWGTTTSADSGAEAVK